MNGDIFTRKVFYKVPGMEDVEVRRDLVYQRMDDGTELKMDVYVPPGLAPEERRPGVAFVHGGPLPPEAWPTAKDWGVFVSYARLVAASGFIGVAFSHRFPGMDRIEESAAHVAAALSFVRERAAELHLDADRMGVWAFSAGGPPLGPFLMDRPSWVRCLLGYCTVLDLRPLREQHQDVFSEEVANRFSPVACLPESGYEGPPVLLARGGLDRPGLNQTIDAFVARALAANVPLDVMNHPQGPHGFETLVDDARTRGIVARSLEFLKAHL